MTDRDIILGVVNKLDKEKFEVNTFFSFNDVEVYRRKSETEINFEFDEEGNLVDIWVST